MARLCLDQTFLSFCHRRHVAALCMLYKVNSNLNHCLFSELPSASLEFDVPRCQAAAHSIEFEVSGCIKSQFEMCFLPAKTSVWNDLPYTMFETGTLDGFKEAVNHWLLPLVYFSIFRGIGACVVAESIYKQFCLSHLGLCCSFK